MTEHAQHSASVGWTALLAMLLLSVVGACSTQQVRSHVNTNWQGANLAELEQPQQKIAIGVSVEHKTAGARNAQLTAAMREAIQNTLEQSQYFSKVYSGTAVADNKLLITVENMRQESGMKLESSNQQNAGGASFMRPAGPPQSQEDSYVISATFFAADGRISAESYTHGIVTSVQEVPFNSIATGLTTMQAYKQMTSDVITKMLYDFRKGGVL